MQILGHSCNLGDVGFEWNSSTFILKLKMHLSRHISGLEQGSHKLESPGKLSFSWNGKSWNFF